MHAPAAPSAHDAAPSEHAALAAEDAGTPAPWLDFRGTSVLGFGLLRVVPPETGGPARFHIRYRETPNDGYSITDNAQIFVLPGTCFASTDRAYADAFLAFARTPPSDTPPYELVLDVEFEVAAETTLLVGYGPWTGPDTGRPSGDDPTFSLAVEALTPGAAAAWVESEAGELVTTNWTGRPGVARGGPATDAVTGADVWIEVRPLILYDAALARGSDETAAADAGSSPEAGALLAEADRLARDGRDAQARDARERAADLRALAARRDVRIPLTPELAARFRRVPIRWR